MSTDLWCGPRWVRLLFYPLMMIVVGLFIAWVSAGTETLFNPPFWPSYVLGLVALFAVGGLLIALVNEELNSTLAAAVSGLSRSQRRAAAKAASRGPIPQDPAVRVSARRIAEAQLEGMRSPRSWLTTIATLVLLLGAIHVALAISDGHADSQSFVVLPALAGVIIGQWFVARRSRRRIAELADPPHQEDVRAV